MLVNDNFTNISKNNKVENSIIHEYHLNPIFGKDFDIPVLAEITSDRILPLPRADLIKTATVTFFADNTGKLWLNDHYLLNSDFKNETIKIDKNYFLIGNNTLKFYCKDTNLVQGTNNTWFIDLLIKFEY